MPNQETERQYTERILNEMIAAANAAEQARAEEERVAKAKAASAIAAKTAAVLARAVKPILPRSEPVARAAAPVAPVVPRVEPGFVATELSSSLHRGAAKVRAMRQAVPLGRVGTVEEIAAAVAFLASPNASDITRQNLAVTGGR